MKNGIREETATFFHFSITKHFQAAKNISGRRPIECTLYLRVIPFSCFLRKKKKIKVEGSTLHPQDRVEVPGGDVSKNLRNLGNSQEELSVSSGTFLHPTKTNNIWTDSRRFPGPPAASQTLRAWPWERGSS